MSSTIPSGLILVNNDINSNIIKCLKRQLFLDGYIDGYIDGYVDGYAFDSLVNNDSNYVSTIKSKDRRLMVLKSFDDLLNRELFDVVVYIKNGLASVEVNKYGPHGITVPVIDITWQKLYIFKR
jgi:hypothetical protein